MRYRRWPACLALAFLLLTSAVRADVALVDQPGGVRTNGTDSTTLTVSSLALSAGVNLLVCWMGIDGSTGLGSSVTWNGSEGFTRAMQKVHSAADATVELWYRVNPTVTTANVVGVIGTTNQWVLKCLSFSGVDTGSPFGGTETSTEVNAAASSISRVVTVPTGGQAIDGVAKSTVAGSLTVGAGQTQLTNLEDTPSGAIRVAASQSTDSGSNTMSWSIATGAETVQIAAAVQPALPGAGVTEALTPILQ